MSQYSDELKRVGLEFEALKRNAPSQAERFVTVVAAAHQQIQTRLSRWRSRISADEVAEFRSKLATLTDTHRALDRLVISASHSAALVGQISALDRGWMIAALANEVVRRCEAWAKACGTVATSVERQGDVAAVARRFEPTASAISFFAHGIMLLDEIAGVMRARHGATSGMHGQTFVELQERLATADPGDAWTSDVTLARTAIDSDTEMSAAHPTPAMIGAAIDVHLADLAEWDRIVGLDAAASDQLKARRSGLEPDRFEDVTLLYQLKDDVARELEAAADAARALADRAVRRDRDERDVLAASGVLGAEAVPRLASPPVTDARSFAEWSREAERLGRELQRHAAAGFDRVEEHLHRRRDAALQRCADLLERPLPGTALLRARASRDALQRLTAATSLDDAVDAVAAMNACDVDAHELSEIQTATDERWVQAYQESQDLAQTLLAALEQYPVPGVATPSAPPPFVPGVPIESQEQALESHRRSLDAAATSVRAFLLQRGTVLMPWLARAASLLGPSLDGTVPEAVPADAASVQAWVAWTSRLDAAQTRLQLALESRDAVSAREIVSLTLQLEQFVKSATPDEALMARVLADDIGKGRPEELLARCERQLEMVKRTTALLTSRTKLLNELVEERDRLRWRLNEFFAQGLQGRSPVVLCDRVAGLLDPRLDECAARSHAQQAWQLTEARRLLTALERHARVGLARESAGR